jgi:hypothetical protein
MFMTVFVQAMDANPDLSEDVFVSMGACYHMLGKFDMVSADTN